MPDLPWLLYGTECAADDDGRSRRWKDGARRRGMDVRRHTCVTLRGSGVLLSNWTRGPWFFIRDILKESNFWVGSCAPHCLYAKSVPTPTQRHGWIGEWLRCCAFLLLLYSSVLDVWCGLFFTQLVYLFNHKKADLTILSFPNLELIGLDLFPASFCFHFRKLILLEVSRERRSSLLYICMHACMLVR